MRRLSRTTIIIFILSFVVIYVKFMKIEDQLMSVFVPELSAKSDNVKTTTVKDASTLKKEPVKSKTLITAETDNDKILQQAKVNKDAKPVQKVEPKQQVQQNQNAKKQFNEDTSFETCDFSNVEFETAKEIINLRALRDIEFFDKAISNISESKLDAKINELKGLVKELKKVQATINKDIKRKNQLENENIDNLVRVIESMNPKQAATMFTGLNIDTRVLLVRRMDQEKLSSIVSLLDPKISTETFERALQKD